MLFTLNAATVAKEVVHNGSAVDKQQQLLLRLAKPPVGMQMPKLVGPKSTSSILAAEQVFFASNREGGHATGSSHRGPVTVQSEQQQLQQPRQHDRKPRIGEFAANHAHNEASSKDALQPSRMHGSIFKESSINTSEDIIDMKHDDGVSHPSVAVRTAQTVAVKRILFSKEPASGHTVPRHRNSTTFEELQAEMQELQELQADLQDTAVANDRGPLIVTMLIRECTSVEQLTTLFKNHHSTFNVINVTAFLVQLSRVAPAKCANSSSLVDDSTPVRSKTLRGTAQEERRQLEKFVRQQLGGLVNARILEFDAQGVANVLHALAKLQISHPCIDDLLYVSTQFLESYDDKALSMLAYSVGKLSARPDRQWVTAFFRRSLALIRAKQVQAQALVNMLWGLAKMQMHPDRDWCAAFYKQCSKCLLGFTSHGLSSLVWALATLEMKVPEWLQSQLVDASAGLMQRGPGFTDQGLANLIWGLARIKCKLPAPWVACFTQTTFPRLMDYSPEVLATLLYSFAHAGIEPPAPWLQRIQQQLLLHMPRSSAHVLANTLYSFAKLNTVPEQQLVLSLLSHIRWQLSAFTPQALSNTIWALARLQLSPGSYWMASFMEESFVKLPMFNAQELSNTIWALSVLQHWPDSMWMARFERESEQRLHFYVVQNLSNTAMAFAKFRYSPGMEWRTGFIKQLQIRLKSHQWSLAQISDTLHGLAVLNLQAPTPVMDQLFEQSLPRLPMALPAELARLLHAVATLRVMPPRQWLGLLVADLSTQVHALDAEALCNTVWAFAQLGYSPRTAPIEALCAALTQQLPACSPAGICRVVEALAELEYTPSRQWLDGVLVRLQAVGVQRLDAGQLLGLINGLHALGYARREQLLDMFANHTTSRL